MVLYLVEKIISEEEEKDKVLFIDFSRRSVGVPSERAIHDSISISDSCYSKAWPL